MKLQQIVRPLWRYLTLILPGLTLLLIWLGLLSFAFPSLYQQAGLGSYGGEGTPGTGLPANIAWLVNFSGSLGMSFLAAAIWSYCEEIYRKHQPMKREENPAYTTVSDKYTRVFARAHAQADRLDRDNARIKQLLKLKAIFVGRAVAAFELRADEVRSHRTLSQMRAGLFQQQRGRK